MPEPAPDLVIVGNAPLVADHSRLIDEAGTVVRINGCDFWGGQAGSKIDVLAISNTGMLPLEYLEQRPRNFGPCVERCSALLLPRDTATSAAFRKSGDARVAEAFIDNSGALEGYAKRNGKAVLRPEPLESTELQRELATLQAEPFVMPSTGACVAHYYLRRMPPKHILFVGFRHAGWVGHPWDAERVLFQNYRKLPNVSFIDD